MLSLRWHGVCGALDPSEEFLAKIPTVGPEKMCKIRSNVPP